LREARGNWFSGKKKRASPLHQGQGGSRNFNGEREMYRSARETGGPTEKKRKRCIKWRARRGRGKYIAGGADDKP